MNYEEFFKEAKKMEIGQKIAQLRKDKKIPQRTFANRIEISNKHLSEIENGKKYPRWQLLVKILRQLDANIIIENSKTIIETTNIKL